MPFVYLGIEFESMDGEKYVVELYSDLSASTYTSFVLRRLRSNIIPAVSDYVTGGNDVAVLFNSTRLDGHHIVSVMLQDNQSFTETNNRARDGAAFYVMPSVCKRKATHQIWALI